MNESTFQSPLPANQILGDSGKPGILLVEDNEITANTLDELLRAYGGFDVYRASTVQQARFLAEKFSTVRFIVLDMQLDNADANANNKLSGIVLLREFSEMLPKAKIYMKSSVRFSHEVAEIIRSYNSVVKVTAEYDAVEISRLAGVVYGNGRMRPRIFIVHGHDHDALDQLQLLVSDGLGLGDPVVISREPEEGRVILEKFEDYARHADLVFALLTPDDASDSGRRARQNVIFEVGYFAAALGRRSGKLILLKKADTEMPSDMAGLLTVDISQGIRGAAGVIRNQLKGWWGMTAVAGDN